MLGLLLQSCVNPVNEKTSWISSLNTECLDDSAWTHIKRAYSTDNITDKKLVRQLAEMKKMPFPTDILYFKDSPEELIGVEYYGVRYVYNEDISSQVLNGLSPELSNAEKKRIQKRIQTLLMEYQCTAGKAKALKFLELPNPNGVKEN